MEYLGHLSKNDPLYTYLRHHVLPQIDMGDEHADFRVFRLHASNHVFLYEDKYSRTRLIGKFFGGIEGRSRETAFRYMEREYNNLNWLRELGFRNHPHYVVRPFGRNANLDCLLVEEFSKAIPLMHFLHDASRGKKTDVLYEKLTALAFFLAQLHNKTASHYQVEFEQEAAYFRHLMDKLNSLKYLSGSDSSLFYQLLNRWKNQSCMYEDIQVIVHGDPTPANILFGDELSVVAIDLERMKSSDRVFDVGRVAGEIKHHFMQQTGNRYASEPFIGHFLWEYCCHFPDRQRAFDAITQRLPFYLGMTLLRIARNTWVSNSYRRQLFAEAARNLQ